MIYLKRILSFLIDFYVVGFVWVYGVRFMLTAVPLIKMMLDETIVGGLVSMVLLGIVAGAYFFLAQRTLGQRILRLEFYRKDDAKITFWRNAVVHGLLVYPFLTISIIPNIIFSYTKESLWMDTVSKLYVRNYEKRQKS